ncbi:MAG: ribosome biogenesis GTP-binding protein YsxC [Parcubacteria bacterium C7867-004]|nr:MAG: ribosome biogenesis GTP-binding protein YsxC [Parcubacteria bacterium C7867-004]
MDITSAEFVKGVVGSDGILFDGVPQVAFIGRSNVGKSSVINSLVNRNKLVKVGKKPGKTTELNFFSINERQVYFVDLPGYGYAKLGPSQRESIEKLISWYLLYSEVKPKMVVLILDIKAGVTDFDQQTIAMLKEQGHSFVIVANKIDKLNQKERSLRMSEIRKEAGTEEVIAYSAKDKKGVEELLAAIS